MKGEKGVRLSNSGATAWWSVSTGAWTSYKHATVFKSIAHARQTARDAKLGKEMQDYRVST